MRMSMDLSMPLTSVKTTADKMLLQAEYDGMHKTPEEERFEARLLMDEPTVAKCVEVTKCSVTREGATWETLEAAKVPGVGGTGFCQMNFIAALCENGVWQPSREIFDMIQCTNRVVPAPLCSNDWHPCLQVAKHIHLT